MWRCKACHKDNLDEADCPVCWFCGAAPDISDNELDEMYAPWTI